jgi:hypothetical protein
MWSIECWVPYVTRTKTLVWVFEGGGGDKPS